MSAHFYPGPTGVTSPKLSTCWRDETGRPHASVDLAKGTSAHIILDDPAEARELAGQIIAAAMWLEVAIAESQQAVTVDA